MKILVTGGLGFIGSNFIRFMLNEQRAISIINLDNLSYGSNPNNLEDFKGNIHYEFIKGDITNKRLIERLINSKNIDIVINFAAQSHVDRSIANPISFYKNNVGGVLSILEAIRKSKRNIRFIQIGTDESYGEILDGSFREEDRLKPSSPYSASKAAADLFCLAYQRTYGLDIVISRCTNNFGPYQFPEKLIPKTIIRAHLGLKVPIYGSGKNVRDWIYVLDYCEALEKLMYRGRSGEIYNVSSGNELDNLTLVKKILGIMGKSEDIIEFVEDRPGHDLRYNLDSTKIRNEMEWRPRHDFEEALKATISWYLSNESWWKPLIDDRVLHPTPWKLNGDII